MKLTVFGATGRTGVEIVEQALALNHEVIAVVRDPAKLGEFQSKVRVVRGDSTDPRTAEDAVSGTDAVLSALGHAGDSSSDFFSRSASNIVQAMKIQNIKRLVVLTNVAAHDPSDRPGLYNRILLLMLKLSMGRIARDTAEEARIVSESGLDWTLVRANVLTNGPLTKKYRIGAFDRNAGTRISRADVADFMISCAIDGKYVRAMPLISG